MTLLKRIVVEKRALGIPLAIGILVNIGVYVLVVRPLGIKSAGAADRASAAVVALRSAERDLASARALVAGKARAEEAIQTFYGKVLPADREAAVRLTYMPLPLIARKANVKIVARRTETEVPKRDALLGRLHMYAALQGEYEGFRQFIFDLETASEFVIIDDVTLTQGDPGKPLTLTLEMSTYYPLTARGPHGN